MKLSDYLVKKLEKYGLRHAFMITGGGAMHLDDSFGKSKKIKCIFNHNEQACAMTAEGYARTNQKLAIACVTTGPGGLNCLNGLFGAYTDSAPVLFISGQVKFSTTLASCPNIPLRQLGDQEVDIVSVVKPLTKYATMLANPYDIDLVLGEAVNTALSGRFGPVWLDIPLNVQSAEIDIARIKKYKPKKQRQVLPISEIDKAVKLLKSANKPLIVAGHGIRLSGTQKYLEKLLKQTGAPVVTTFNGMDIVSSENIQFAGRIGTVGQRAGNFALQNADVILFLGTRNNIRQVSYNWQNFAKNAKKIIVDIDKAELDKPTIRPNIAICADLRAVLPELIKRLNRRIGSKNWLKHCQNMRLKYKPLNEFKISAKDKVHPYLFMKTLGELLQEKDIAVASNGTACVAFFQAFPAKNKQRLLLNSGNASMGYGLPAAIGACVSSGKSTVCIEGDGSIMMNLQELQTIKTNNLPIKIFIIKNGGYISIIQTQRNFFNGRLTGCNAASGVEVPNFIKIAKAFGLPALCVNKNSQLKSKISKVLNMQGAVVCVLDCIDNYTFAPKLSARKLPDGTMVTQSLEDMHPFLDRKELKENLF